MKFFSGEKYIGTNIYIMKQRAQEHMSKDIAILSCFSDRLPVITEPEWEQYCAEFTEALDLTPRRGDIDWDKLILSHRKLRTIEIDIMGIHCLIVFPKHFAGMVVRHRE